MRAERRCGRGRIYDGTTIAGETVGDVAFQIQTNLADSGWQAQLSPNGTYVVVNGHKNGVNPNITDPVTAVGINYSGMAQPVGPKTVGAVQLLILQADGTWKAKGQPE